MHNTASGKPLELPLATAKPPGQLVYYFQRVDRFKHAFGREHYERALRVVNLSKTAGLHGMLGIFLGMRVRLTNKIFSLEFV